MKAIVYTEYGEPDVLNIQEVEKPYPKGNEVLIRVRAVSVNYGFEFTKKNKYTPLIELAASFSLRLFSHNLKPDKL
jgi:Zn-dependent alcohol dehydrogenase